MLDFFEPGWGKTTEALKGTHFSLEDLTALIFLLEAEPLTCGCSCGDGQCLVSTELTLEFDLEDAAEPHALTLGTGAGAKFCSFCFFSAFGEGFGEGNCVWTLESSFSPSTFESRSIGSGVLSTSVCVLATDLDSSAAETGVVEPVATTSAYELADIFN